MIHWVGQTVHFGFSTRCYEKPKQTFWLRQYKRTQPRAWDIAGTSPLPTIIIRYYFHLYPVKSDLQTVSHEWNYNLHKTLIHGGMNHVTLSLFMSSSHSVPIPHQYLAFFWLKQNTSDQLHLSYLKLPLSSWNYLHHLHCSLSQPIKAISWIISTKYLILNNIIPFLNSEECYFPYRLIIT